MLGNNGRSGYIDVQRPVHMRKTPINPSGTLLGEADFMLGLPDNLGRGLQSGTWGQRAVVPGILLPGRLACHQESDFESGSALGIPFALGRSGQPAVQFRDVRTGARLCLAGGSPAGVQRVQGALITVTRRTSSRAWASLITRKFSHKKLVFRGAYTISSYLEGTGTNLRETLNPPFYQEFAAIYNIAGVANELPGSTLDQGLSALNPKNPYAGATFRLWNPDVHPAKVQQWNFSAEYELPGAKVLTVGYVDSTATHLMVP